MGFTSPPKLHSWKWNSFETAQILNNETILQTVWGGIWIPPWRSLKEIKMASARQETKTYIFLPCLFTFWLYDNVDIKIYFLLVLHAPSWIKWSVIKQSDSICERNYTKCNDKKILFIRENRSNINQITSLMGIQCFLCICL